MHNTSRYTPSYIIGYIKAVLRTDLQRMKRVETLLLILYIDLYYYNKLLTLYTLENELCYNIIVAKAGERNYINIFYHIKVYYYYVY